MALSGGLNGWIFLLAFIGSVIFAVLFGIIMDFIINKPLKGEPVFSVIMATISLAIILRSLTAILAGPLSIIPISPFGDQTFFLNGVVISILDISIIFSAIIISFGLMSLILNNGPKLSIDFTGGTVIQIKFDAPINITKIRRLPQSKK